MAATMEEKKIPDVRNTKLAMQAKRIEEMRKLVGELETLDQRTQETSNRLHLAAYEWVTDAVDIGMLRSISSGIGALAKTMRAPFGRVQGWYHIGEVIKKNDLPMTAKGVSMLWLKGRHLSKSAVLSVVQAIKDDAPRGTITQIIANDKGAQKSSIRNRLSLIEKRGQLTKNYLRMEMLALLTMARKVYGRDDVMIHVTDTGYAPLMVVGDDKRKAATA